MNTTFLTPARQLALIIDRIYGAGLTTAAGGNLSVRGKDGIWITPSGIDKGALTERDMCKVMPDGSYEGKYKPSVELPIHAAVYERRADIAALLHAHPPSLSAFAAARRIPDLSLYAGLKQLGPVTAVPYAPPGTRELSDGVAAAFARGYNAVIMENHGVCVGAGSLLEACGLFETLESAALTELYARGLGELKPVNADLVLHVGEQMPELPGRVQSDKQTAKRRELAGLISRLCRRRIFTAAIGTISARLSGDEFIITPSGIHRGYIGESELVYIRGDYRERGKTPDFCAHLHRAVYNAHADIGAIALGIPPFAMAYAVTETPFRPQSMPESFAVIGQTPRVAFADLCADTSAVYNRLGQTPVLMLDNYGILTAGSSPGQAFDRLETAEAAACAGWGAANLSCEDLY